MRTLSAMFFIFLFRVSEWIEIDFLFFTKRRFVIFKSFHNSNFKMALHVSREPASVQILYILKVLLINILTVILF